VLPLVQKNSIDFNSQFSCDKDHSMYGFIHATRRDLDNWSHNPLPKSFYTKHILPHFRLHRRQWIGSLASMVMLEYGDINKNEASPFYAAQMRVALNTVMDEDMRFPVSTYVDAEGNTHVLNQTAANRFVQVMFAPEGRMDSMKMLMIAKEAVVVSAIPLTFRILVAILPAVEETMVRLFWVIVLERAEIKRAVVEMPSKWKYTLIGLALYLLRSYYWPYYGASGFHAPVTDLKFVLNNPTRYRTTVRTSVKLFIVRIAAEAVYAIVIGFFREANYIAWSEQDFEKSPTKPQDLTLRKFSRHIGLSYRKFWDFVYLERKCCEAIYIVIDLINISSALFLSATWSWTIFHRLIMAALHILMREFGPIVPVLMMIVGILWLIWTYLWVGFVLKSLIWYIVYIPLRTLVFRPVRFFCAYLVFAPVQLAYKTATTNISATLNFVAVKAKAVLSSIDPKYAAPVIAVGILTFLLYLTLSTIDPIKLRSSHSACARAYKIAHRLKNSHRMTARLGWMRPESMELVPLEPFTLSGLDIGMFKF